jgi:hypothetical protein
MVEQFALVNSQELGGTLEQEYAREKEKTSSYIAEIARLLIIAEEKKTKITEKADFMIIQLANVMSDTTKIVRSDGRIGLFANYLTHGGGEVLYSLQSLLTHL